MPGTTAEAPPAVATVQTKQPVPKAGLGDDKGSTEKTYTQAEWHDREGKHGQRLDAVTKEKATFQTQVDNLTSELTDAKKSLERTKELFEGLSSDNPDAQEFIGKAKKIVKNLEDELDNAKKERKAFNDSAAEKIKYAEKRDRDDLVYEVAGEHGAETPEDYNRFMVAADKLKINDREGLETLAETMSLKRVEEEEKQSEKLPILHSDSGKNKGGRQGHVPTIEELRSSHPYDTKKKYDSGEWVRR